MDILTIAVVVMAATFVVLACVAIPAFIETRKAAGALRDFIVRTDSELQPALKDIHRIVDDLKPLAEEAGHKTGDVKVFFEAIGDAGRNLRAVNYVVGTVVGIFSTSSVWLTGTKVARKYIFDRISHKGGK